MPAQKFLLPFMVFTGGTSKISHCLKWKVLLISVLNWVLILLIMQTFMEVTNAKRCLVKYIRGKRIKTGGHCIVYQMRVGSSSSKSAGCKSEIL